MTFRFGLGFIALVTLIILLLVRHFAAIQMADPNFINGWIFFTFLILLMLYYVRKKLNVLPLGKMEYWLAFHLLCATGFIVTYCFHIGATLPDGWFNLTLWASNLAVILTGLVGLSMSKTLPKEIRQIAQRPTQEEIPQLKRKLIDDAEQTVLDYLQSHYSEPLHRLFTGSIYPFLVSPVSLYSTITQGHKPFRQLLTEIEELDYFVSTEEQAVLTTLKQKVKRKHHLDRQSLLQSMLKHWLFLHVSSTLVLLIFVALHIFAVYGFSMGAA